MLGGKDLSCNILDYLGKSGKEVVAVIGNNEEKEEKWYVSLNEKAKELKIPLLTPSNVNSPEFIQELKKLKPDIGFCNYYSQILKKEFLDSFPKGCINLHFAPLPKYRGVMPITWAIINGEKTHGVTMHYIDVGIDDGDIIAKKEFTIEEDDTGLDVYRKCERYGMELFKETFPLIEKGEQKRELQDGKEATYYSKKDLTSFEVDPSWNEKKKYDFIRALTFPPLKPAFMVVNGKKIMVTTKVNG